MSVAASDKEVKSRVVKLVGKNKGLCSGSQIRTASGHDYILSAAHCIDLKDKNDLITVHDEFGNILERRVIAEDPRSDLMLLEGLPNMKGLPIAKQSFFGQHMRAFTHGSGFATWKSEGVLIDEKTVTFQVNVTADRCNQPKMRLEKITFFYDTLFVCVFSVSESVTDTKITPGSSGGMFVNDRGELMGVASAGGGGWGYIVRTVDINAFLSIY